VKFQRIVKHYIPISIIAASLVLQWYARSSGLILTQDSQHYITASESFKQTLTFIDNNGHFYLFWPPLFPIILSATTVSSFVWINCILTLCISLLALNIIKRTIENSIVQNILLAFIVLGVHLLLTSTFLWSELFFLLFTVIFIDQLQKSEHSRNSFFFAVAAGILMCLQRNVGAFIALGGAVWIFIGEGNRKEKFIQATYFFFSVTSVLFIWNAYVWFFVPHPHFNFSEKFFQNALSNIDSITYAVVNTFIPTPFFYIPVALVSFFILLYYLKNEIKENRKLQLIFIVTLLYLILLTIILVINFAGFPIDRGEGDRFISVIIPFLSILVFKSFDKFYNTQGSSVRILLILAVCAWMIYPLARTLKNAIQWHEVSAYAKAQKYP
jgi:hypothetical protein